MTDAGLKGVAALRHLRRLDLGHTRVSDAGAGGLVGLANLASLPLIDTRVTAEGVAMVRTAMPNCFITD